MQPVCNYPLVICPSYRRPNRGFTLVELIMTIVVISIASVGITSALSFALGHQSDSLPQAKTVGLAQAYIEEIFAKRYDENSPIGGVPACSAATTACTSSGNFDDGESRARFDDVDDYDGVDDLPPLRVDGTALAEYARFRVQVEVAYADAGQVTALGLNDPTDAKIVTVTVTPPAGTPLAFTAIRTNY